jgi:chorismate-pyruvate lyase
MRRRLLIPLSSLQRRMRTMFLIVAFFAVIFVVEMTMISVEVSAWISHHQRHSSSSRRPAYYLSSRSTTTITMPLLLYQKGGGGGGGGEGKRNEQKKQQQLLSSSSAGFKDNKKQQSDFFFNTTTTTSLFYTNDENNNNDGTATDVLVPKNNETLATTTNNNNPSSSIQQSTTAGAGTGTFGDIMSQPNNGNADLLFRDGLVTSETYSLEDIYGISNPLDRMAVTANGNLQRLFSSYYDAPVVVEMVHCMRQKQQDGDVNDVNVNINNNNNNNNGAVPIIHAVWDRRVLLKIFNQTFCTADSVIVVHSQEVEDLVESGKVGIGQIFRHFNILPEFNLLKAGLTTTTNDGDDSGSGEGGGGFWRYYTLESDLVTCSIREVFCNDVWNLSPSDENI